MIDMEWVLLGALAFLFYVVVRIDLGKEIRIGRLTIKKKK